MTHEDQKACPSAEPPLPVLVEHSGAFSAAAARGPKLPNQPSQLFSPFHGSSASALVSPMCLLLHPTAMEGQLPRQCPEDSFDESLSNSTVKSLPEKNLSDFPLEPLCSQQLY